MAPLRRWAGEELLLSADGGGELEREFAAVAAPRLGVARRRHPRGRGRPGPSCRPRPSGADVSLPDVPGSRSSSRPRKRSALAELDPGEKAAVLDELLRSRPGLRAEAERVAREHLIDTDVERVAESVAWEIEHLGSDELAGRAGKHRWGYVEPTEAAWELLEEALGAFDREIERLLALDMTGPAVDAALGVIAGLYRCRGCDDGDVLLSWAPDFLLEHAGSVVDRLTKAGAEPPGESIADLAPEWAHWLANRTRARA